MLQVRQSVLGAAMLVACGSGVGASVRWLVTSGFAERFEHLIVVVLNAVGSLVLGVVLSQYSRLQHPKVVLGVGTGFCGGLTTFSTFALHVSERFFDGEIVSGITLATSTAVVVVGCAAVGYRAGHMVKGGEL